jgi:hypothetical protein
MLRKEFLNQKSAPRAMGIMPPDQLWDGGH